jgi:small basic protein
MSDLTVASRLVNIAAALVVIVGCLGAVALSLAFAFVGSYAGIPLGLAVIIATIATAAAMHLLATWAVTP